MNKGKNKGITLIALIITIIITLILASISVVIVIKKDGLLQNTQNAKESYNYESAKELLDEKLAEIEMKMWSTKQRAATFEDIIEALSDEDEVDIIIKEYSPTARVELVQTGANMIEANSIQDITVEINNYLFKITHEKTTSYIGIIGANGLHLHNFSHQVTKEASCTEDGAELNTCLECNESYTKVIPKTGHICNTYENIEDPTCTQNGIERGVCEVCGEECDRAIPALGHLESEEYSYSALGHYHCCTRCGEAMGQEEAHTSDLRCTICGYTGTFTVSYNLYRLNANNQTLTVHHGESYTTTITPQNSLAYQRPNNIIITMGGDRLTNGYTYNNVNGEINISNITGNIVITATAENYSDNTCFTNALASTTQQIHIVNITQAYQIRVYSFIPETSGSYTFYTNDTVANTNATDDYAYLYSNRSRKNT